MWKSTAQRTIPSAASNVLDAFGQSPSVQSRSKPVAPDEDEVDPLDAFMAQLEKETAQEPPKKKVKSEAEMMEADDAVASYYDEASGRRRKAPQGNSDSEEQRNSSDSEGDRRRKPIEGLEPIDHSQVVYEPFRKDFYAEHEEIRKLAAEEVAELRSFMRISATGSDVPRPACSFAHFGFKKDIMDCLRKLEFAKPTAIQAQGIPCALKGRDAIGIAETGSGKTLAYVLPMLIHVMDQRHIEKGEGPIALTLAPTRELSLQIEREIYRFGKKMGITSIALVGGMSKHEQFKVCKAGCEILIGTPGRVIDVIKLKGITLTRVTLMILDEADRMFDMGFEYQVLSIVRNTRADRQTLLFSATFPPKIERLARDTLSNPLRITIGQLGQATENVEQRIEILNDEDKWNWIAQNILSMTAEGQVLVFVQSRKGVEEFKTNCESFLDIRVSMLHGDLDQSDRIAMMRQFRKRETSILIATDVASRGLDIPSIRFVISYDAATSIETHTHRIGRTGRAGEKGVAVTLLTRKEKKLAAHLVEQLETQGQGVPHHLLELALTHPAFQAARASGSAMSQQKGKGKGKPMFGNIGLGFEGGATTKKSKSMKKDIKNQADMEFQRNRMAQQGRQKDPAKTITGFVAAKLDTADNKIQSTEVSSDSDEDLFAPGVTTKFGVANRVAQRPPAMAHAMFTHPAGQWPRPPGCAPVQGQQLGFTPPVQQALSQGQQLPYGFAPPAQPALLHPDIVRPAVDLASLIPQQQQTPAPQQSTSAPPERTRRSKWD
eukprot:GEMP01016441.1.p1 GENE.GEMP01016441.1~~GEMP01016441.1.p1  ORF type:complete len:776 (+),score=196.14 GEMP01016441.1:89-2416(+)